MDKQFIMMGEHMIQFYKVETYWTDVDMKAEETWAKKQDSSILSKSYHIMKKLFFRVDKSYKLTQFLSICMYNGYTYKEYDPRKIREKVMALDEYFGVDYSYSAPT